MSDLLTYQAAQNYLAALVPPREKELQEMEAHAAKHDFPIIGPACGYYCYQLARMINARSIFELGSGYGYSTAWFAKAIKETIAEQGGGVSLSKGRSDGGGIVHHTVWDQELSQSASRHLSALGYGDLVRYHVSEAVEALGKTEGPFDIIFNDIDKQAYPASLPLITEKLRKGGLLIIDNMLWSGRIFDKSDISPATEGVREFTKQITSDSGWIVSLAPMRDGMIVAFKK